MFSSNFVDVAWCDIFSSDFWLSATILCDCFFFLWLHRLIYFSSNFVAGCADGGRQVLSFCVIFCGSSLYFFPSNFVAGCDDGGGQVLLFCAIYLWYILNISDIFV